ncbi:sigma-70 family RNA polymerase sigma factor [Blastopirellula sp. JC732]|uniref:Sigma-70 family RNA polymerase sigma factor n=1 Tax=Blastopirellula sediminis TaxID=2894196 RepID=A0A9X1SI36_9BACT|nr:sigma-70 family RNA polymerase sigma factor [Blastopirellula sediminis]MCC9605879.1 sigma-70 family RNA polymerase sigma factor [Blastopirellula sediminis]MCC9630822.1 sigma-70 family RNA polymerase sigma factor [Blastopirellula sediminis]
MPDKDSISSEEIRDWPQLLSDARSGDEAAIDHLWRCMRTYLLLIAESGLGDGLTAKVDASDIVQNSLLEAQRDFSRFTGDSESELKSWLRQLLKHNLIDVGRRFRHAKSRDVSLEQSLNGKTPIDLVDRRQSTASSIIRREETDLELLRALAQLPLEQRRLVEMRHRRGLTYKEIGQELGVSEKTVRNRWAAAIAQLQKELDRSDEFSG